MTGVERYPGIGNRLIICAVCGFKFRVKQTDRIEDKYNLLNKMIVCRACNEKANPQFYPFKLPVEKLLSDPTYVHPESEIITYAPNPGTILPSAPKNLQAHLDPLSNQIYLIWEGSENMGSQPILGYIIKRADPQFANLLVINANTQTPASYYLDTTADVNLRYTYQVATITAVGVSPYSNYAYWTMLVEDLSLPYIAADNQDILMTDDGYYILEG